MIKGCCDCEYAQRLKELNCRQGSLWYWVKVDRNFAIVDRSERNIKYYLCLGINKAGRFYFDEEGHKGTITLDAGVVEYYSAFTVAELGEMLPLYLNTDAARGLSFSVETEGLQSRKSYNGETWDISYGCRHESSNTEANTRAKMLIYLLEHKLIEVPK